MLAEPTILAPGLGLKFSMVFTGKLDTMVLRFESSTMLIFSGVPGPTACHTICVTEEGKAYSFGRNNNGQLGHGDFLTRGSPTVIKVSEAIPATALAVLVTLLRTVIDAGSGKRPGGQGCCWKKPHVVFDQRR